MIALLIVGVVLLAVAYTVPNIPPPLGMLCRLLGIICTAIALILIVLGLLGMTGLHVWPCK